MPNWTCLSLFDRFVGKTSCFFPLLEEEPGAWLSRAPPIFFNTSAVILSSSSSDAGSSSQL